MAFLQTTIRTYFKDGYYRNNTVKIEIPNEAAELIRKFWNEKGGVYNCAKAKFLAHNQLADAELLQDETLLGGVSNMYTEGIIENETFERNFVDDEDEDDE